MAGTANSFAIRSSTRGSNERGVSLLNSISNSCRDSCMGDRFQFLPERFQGISIARSGSVGGDFEGLGDLLEREFIPDFEHENFALLDWQISQSGLDLLR